jgi:Xaa-Pro aminopeptidase
MYNSELNTPKSELDLRIAKLQIHLVNNNIDAALILQRVDLFYFSGTIQQANLYIPAQGDPILMVVKSSERAMAESAIERIVPLKSLRTIPEILNQNGYDLPGTLGLELDVLPANLYFTYRSIFEKAKIEDISHAIRLIRAVKSAYELDIMRQAGRLSDEVAGTVPELLREGMTELELAGKVEAEARKRGHQGVVRMRLFGSEMFYGHLMSGAAGALPSFLSSPTGGMGPSPAMAQSAGFKKIQRHEPVMVDYIFALNGYYSDHARIFSLGKLPEDLMEAYAVTRKLQEMIKKMAKPGIRSGEIYEHALEKTKEWGYADYFMGFGPERIRLVGHGIGLEVDEFPFLAAGQNLLLEEGMTLALEPKLIFPGKGVLGLENSHVVTKDGLEQFNSFNEEVIVI